MKSLPIKLLGMLVLCLSVISCNKEKPSGTENTTAPGKEAIALKDSADVFIDSANASWKQMMASDDKRLWANERIITEITSLDTYDAEACKKMLAMVNEVKQQRYNPENMAENGKIDRYDTLTDKLWAETRALISKHPKINKYILVEQLKNEIAVALDSQVIYRINYDKKAKALRNFGKANQQVLEQLGAKYSQLNKTPVFEIGYQ
jgi:hypothetical protein